MSNFDKIVEKLYEKQISQQLGVEVRASGPEDTGTQEEKEFIPGWGYNEGEMSVKAWRRPPRFSEWRISIGFGDSGHECDPGIYMSTDKEKILAILKRHREQLDKVEQFIKDNF